MPASVTLANSVSMLYQSRPLAASHADFTSESPTFSMVTETLGSKSGHSIVFRPNTSRHAIVLLASSVPPIVMA